MATTAVFRDMNVIGNRREDVFELSIESGDTTAGYVQTRLSWIESAVVSARGENSSSEPIDPSILININSQTESSADPNPGWFFISGIADPGTSATFYCRAIGW